MCFLSASPIIYPYLFEPIHHIHPACLSRKQKLWFHILIIVSLSWLQWVMVNMFQISHPYYSRAWEAFFSNTTLPLKLLTAAAIWETEGFSYSYIYSHCSWTEQKLTLILQVGVGVVTALPFLFLPLLPFIQCIILHLIDLNLLLNEIRVVACLMCGEKTHRDMQTIFPRIYSSNDKQKCGFVWNETSALKLNIPRNKCFDCSKICNLQ